MQNERKLSKAVEKIAKRLPDAEFKKRYGKNWMAVKIATAEKLAENFLMAENCGCDACQDEIKERKGKTSRNRKKKKATKKRDRCLRIADRKFDKPSAYKSGAVVRCRKGDIWKGIKEEETLEEKEGLDKWFGRQGASGKEGGWVDCNTCRKDPKTGRQKCKTCGRKKGEKRSKYPACRPTPARCKDPGKGKTWGKTNESQTGAYIVDLILGFFEYIIQKVGKIVARKTLSPETLKKLIRGAYNEHDIVGRQVPEELNSILEKEIDSKQITNIDGLYRRIQQYKNGKSRF